MLNSSLEKFRMFYTNRTGGTCFGWFKSNNTSFIDKFIVVQTNKLQKRECSVVLIHTFTYKIHRKRSANQVEIEALEEAIIIHKNNALNVKVVDKKKRLLSL